MDIGSGRGDEQSGGLGSVGGFLAVTDYHAVGKNVIHDCNFKAIFAVNKHFVVCLLLSCTFFI